MDLLHRPVIGRALRSRRVRVALQLVLLVAAAVIVLHGLLGPQVAPRNLATVLTSIHWRGLLVITLVAAGNLFCTACPMILVRDAGRTLVAPRFRWPQALRGKWVAIALLVAVLFSYELFDLWERPFATALLVLGYFGLALVVDLLFAGAAFCKHVCPIGQFNFIASTLSPAELRVRNGAVCAACVTSDCVNGRSDRAGALLQRGCELRLYLPAKVGNLDCTLCMDCVRACPHDNIALAGRVPAVEWLAGGIRSGVGRLASRPDLAVLAVVFTFGALLNAFAMTAPAYAVERWIGQRAGLHAEAPVLAILFVAALVVLPLALLGAAAVVTRRLTRGGASLRATAMPFAYALVPLGFGAWLAHYGFHFLTGIFTVLPVTQSAAIDLAGWPVLGEPLWRWGGMRPGEVLPIQAGLLLLGAAGSVGLVIATAARDYPGRPRRASIPWLTVVVVLSAAALWIFVQPMDMRGMGGAG